MVESALKFKLFTSVCEKCFWSAESVNGLISFSQSNFVFSLAMHDWGWSPSCQRYLQWMLCSYFLDIPSSSGNDIPVFCAATSQESKPLKRQNLKSVIMEKGSSTFLFFLFLKNLSCNLSRIWLFSILLSSVLLVFAFLPCVKGGSFHVF